MTRLSKLHTPVAYASGSPWPLVAVIVFLIAGPATVQAQPVAPSPSPSIKQLAPLVDEQTFAVVHVRIDRLDHAALAKMAARFADLKPSEAALIELPLNVVLSTLKKKGVTEAYIVLSLSGFPFDMGLAAIPVADEETGKNVAMTLSALLSLASVHQHTAVVEQMKGFVVVAPKTVLKRLQEPRTPAPKYLAEALAEFPKADVQIVAVVPDSLRRSLAELMPQLPQEFGGGKTAPLLKGFRYHSAGIMLAPKFSSEVRVQMADAEAAASLRNMLVDFMKQGRKHIAKETPDPRLLAHVDQLITLFTPTSADGRLTWKLSDEAVTQAIGPFLAEIRRAASRAQSINNLRQIGLAMHNYLDAHKHFPTGIRDKQGKLLLSWRVQILPYVEEQKLYEQFKLDEPWDSEHNIKFAKRMPKVFRNPNSKAAEGKTVYLGPAGKGLFFDKGLPQLKIQNLADGTSNTIMVLEADDDQAVIWSRPDDLSIDPKQPLRGLGGNPMGEFQALFADASARSFLRKMAPAEFYKMLTIAGGEPLLQP